MQHPNHEVERWIGQELIGVDGQPIGTIEDVYLDTATERPEWLVVKTSRLGGISFVPLAEAARHGEGVRVPYAAAPVEQAPAIKPDDGALSQAEEARLYDHHGPVYGETRSGSGLPEYEDDATEVPVERVAPVSSSLADDEHESSPSSATPPLRAPADRRQRRRRRERRAGHARTSRAAPSPVTSLGAQVVGEQRRRTQTHLARSA